MPCSINFSMTLQSAIFSTVTSDFLKQMIILNSSNSMLYTIMITVKILKFGTPQTIAIIVLKIEKFDVTLH